MAILRDGTEVKGSLVVNNELQVKGNILLNNNLEVGGRVKVTGTNKDSGAFYSGTDSPSSSSRLNYDGHFYATRVYNAVWNDIADFVDVREDTDIEFGKAYFRNTDGNVYKTRGKKDVSFGIASDTYGFCGGENSKKRQMPIAVCGWVLAHVDEIYKAGTALVASENGVLTKASLWDKLFYPEKIIATFDRVEIRNFWNGVAVNGRYWVKVK